MEKWICNVCGYTHHGDYPPERCPKCGAPSSSFYHKTRIRWGLIRLLLALMIIATLIVAIFSCSQPLTVDNSTINTLNIDRYAGKWYEIARLDHRFERGMEQCTAIYTIQPNGSLQIVNQGLKDGKWKVTEGKGKTTEAPGLLRVSFFGPFYSDYRVMMLAPDYSYALVGGGNNDMLWILSRTPTLKKATLDNITREARKRGYDTSKLIWVKQTAK